MKKVFLLICAIITITGCKQKAAGEKKIEINVVDADSLALADAYRDQVDSNYRTKQENKPKINIGKIPAFKILTVDNATYTENNLDRKKPVMFIYFSPDCSHCTEFMHALEPKFKDLKDVQIVMATWVRQEALKPFYDTFNLKKYPNFVVGTEGNNTYFIQQYFQIKETPYIAVYDRKGKLVKAYDKAPKVEELMSSVKKA